MTEFNKDRRPLERKIGGTTYIVTSQFSPTAKETAAQKIRRIILKESEKLSKMHKIVDFSRILCYNLIHRVRLSLLRRL